MACPSKFRDMQPAFTVSMQPYMNGQIRGLFHSNPKRGTMINSLISGRRRVVARVSYLSLRISYF